MQSGSRIYFGLDWAKPREATISGVAYRHVLIILSRDEDGITTRLDLPHPEVRYIPCVEYAQKKKKDKNLIEANHHYTRVHLPNHNLKCQLLKGPRSLYISRLISRSFVTRTSIQVLRGIQETRLASSRDRRNSFTLITKSLISFRLNGRIIATFYFISLSFSVFVSSRLILDIKIHFLHSQNFQKFKYIHSQKVDQQKLTIIIDQYPLNVLRFL